MKLFLVTSDVSIFLQLIIVSMVMEDDGRYSLLLTD